MQANKMAISENFELIQNNIEKACQRVKRDPRQVQILAVCKDQGPEKIRQVLDLGIRLLGEKQNPRGRIAYAVFHRIKDRLALHRQTAEK